MGKTDPESNKDLRSALIVGQSVEIYIFFSSDDSKSTSGWQGTKIQKTNTKAMCTLKDRYSICREIDLSICSGTIDHIATYCFRVKGAQFCLNSVFHLSQMLLSSNLA